MIFYDFEVFKHDWLIVLNEPMKKKETVIVNNPDELKKFYEEHNNDIWIGYNSRHYDQYILKAILCDFNPKDINDYIIVKGEPGWKYSDLFRKIPLNNYDVMTTLHSLKQLEGFMGVDIKESSVDFTIDRKLTEEEIKETIRYCRHDVENTILVFLKRKEEFDSMMSLIKTFNLPLSYISKTKAQLSAIILDCVKTNRSDEWDIEILNVLDIKKYKEVLDWFKDKSNYDYSKSLEFDVAGVPHTFGWGGIHGAKEQYLDNGYIIHVDVASYYPSISIEYNLLTRNSQSPEKYKNIYTHRLKLKNEGKKKEQAPYKIVLNGTYGICKDKYSSAYDPRQANRICVNGQLMLLDLIEHLESIKSFELIQSNTDGLIIKVDENDFEEVKKVCNEWETRTRMGLGFDMIDEIWQGDVNNYIFRFKDSEKLERKGGYVKELNDLDNDLPIINKGIVDYLTKGVLPEDTVNNCNDLIMFQNVVKVSSKYQYAMYGNERLKEKCLRVFASKDINDKGVFKFKNETRKPEKIAGTPTKCFIDNSDVRNKKIPRKLDKQWYIDTIITRLKEKFNVEVI